MASKDLDTLYKKKTHESIFLRLNWSDVLDSYQVKGNSEAVILCLTAMATIKLKSGDLPAGKVCSAIILIGDEAGSGAKLFCPLLVGIPIAPLAMFKALQAGF